MYISLHVKGDDAGLYTDMLCMLYFLSLHNGKTSKLKTITDKKLCHLLNICVSKNKWDHAAAGFSATVSVNLILVLVYLRHLCLKQNNN